MTTAADFCRWARKPSQYAYVVAMRDNPHYLLCQDNRWRGMLVHFGDFAECVKEYRLLGWAERKAKRVNGVVYPVSYWQERYAR